jgi:ATP-dependent protease ClpP protease subunit
MYKLVDKGNKSAELMIYDMIGGWDGVTAKRVADDLKSLGRVDVINVRLNSFGGEVFEGYAIYNQLKRHPARVEVDIDGAACSIASIIACAGDTVRMARNAMYMIHDPAGAAFGSSKDMRKTADLLDQVREQLVETYVQRTGLSAAAVSDYMSAETWFKAAEAAELGFVNQVTDELKLAASADLERFHNVPAWARQRATPSATERADRIGARYERLSASILEKTVRIAQRAR